MIDAVSATTFDTEIRDFVTLKEIGMFSRAPQNFLRYVLWADAISCVACGLLQVVFTESLGRILGLPLTLLADTGSFLLTYGAVVGFLATRGRSRNGLIWLLIGGNVAWGVAAVGILLAADMPLTVLGKGYIIAQVLTVLVLAQLQYLCVRPEKANGLASARQRSNE